MTSAALCTTGEERDGDLSSGSEADAVSSHPAIPGPPYARDAGYHPSSPWSPSPNKLHLISGQCVFPALLHQTD